MRSRFLAARRPTCVSGSWPSPAGSGLSVGEAAKQLGIGRTTVYRIMQELREAPDKGCEQGRLHDVREDVVGSFTG